MLVKITLFIALVLSIVVPFIAFFAGEKNRGRYKKALIGNVVAFFGIIVLAEIVLFTGDVSAAEQTLTESPAFATGLGYLAAALVTGMSCIGGGIAVASAASSALGAISEDSSIFGKSLVFVGLAEGVALYGLIISFMILGRL